MKQSLLILAAATTVAFAACNGGNQEGSYTPAQADSIAKAKVDSAQAALKMQNDSAINAKAADEARKADSLRVIDSVIAATKKTSTTTVIKKSGNTNNKKVNQKPNKKDDLQTNEPAVPQPTKQDSKFNDRMNGSKTISEQQKKEQDDKFNRRRGN